MKITKELTLRIELTNKDVENFASALVKIIGVSEAPIHSGYLNTAEESLLKSIYNEIK